MKFIRTIVALFALLQVASSAFGIFGVGVEAGPVYVGTPYGPYPYDGPYYRRGLVSGAVERHEERKYAEAQAMAQEQRRAAEAQAQTAAYNGRNYQSNYVGSPRYRQ